MPLGSSNVCKLLVSGSWQLDHSRGGELSSTKCRGLKPTNATCFLQLFISCGKDKILLRVLLTKRCPNKTVKHPPCQVQERKSKFPHHTKKKSQLPGGGASAPLHSSPPLTESAIGKRFQQTAEQFLSHRAPLIIPLLQDDRRKTPSREKRQGNSD